ncbi:MAG: DNA translocase FtsK [Calditrichaeota bacterium]|nr:DNA translocase FtsK [Calditrichota bacterium]
MARRKTKKKNTKQHRRQANGVLLLGIALILALSVISFDVRDPVSLNAIGQGNIIHNWFGRLGAVLAYYLMQWTLGYPVLILPIILSIFAFQLIMDRSFPGFKKSAIALVVWGVMFSVYLAMPEALSTGGQITEYYPSGLIGGWLASKLVLFLGSFGSVTLLIILTVTLLILSIRLEVAPVLEVLSKAARKFASALKDFTVVVFEKLKTKKAGLAGEVSSALTNESEISQLPEITDEAPAQNLPEIHLPMAKIKEDLSENIPPEPDDKDLLEQLQQSEAETAEEGIQTDLDSLLARLDEARSGQPEEEAPDFPAPADEDMDFEVQEEVKDAELDYDKLVKESIAKYEFPSTDFLTDPPDVETSITREELKTNAELLESRLAEFGIKAKVIRVTAGPVITLYELQPAPGVKVSSIVSLANDLALSMEARGIRIIAPIPGKAAVGIEIPNRQPQIVHLKPLIRSEKFARSDYELPLALGKTISGESYIADLTKMPHLLIAGATGSGKSVGINTILMSLIYSVNPAKVKFVLIDPKKLELSIYRDLQEHYLIWRPDLDEVVITKPSNSVSILNSMTLEMERRYEWLSKLGARNIVEYNKKIQNMPGDAESKFRQLPYIVVVIDELADLMLVAAKEVETPIARLAQMARAVGIHLIVATQRPSVDVITGVIKANFSARIAYLVSSKVDSRTILDINGAEQLLGNGDMLYQPPGSPKPIRLQNPFVTTDEVERVIRHISRQPKLPYYSIPQPGSSAGIGAGDDMMDRDPLYEEARAIVVRHQQGSISFLQRRLKIGFSRAARIMDELERDGVVGPAEGSKPRQVLITLQELQNMR